MTMAHSDTAAGNELYRRLQLSLLLRVILVTFILALTVAIQFSQSPSFITEFLLALYLLSGVSYFITILSLVALRLMRRHIMLAYIQIVWDISFVTALIYITGGFWSIFSFLYLLGIIVGGTLRYRRGTFLAAVLGTMCYGLILAGMETDWIKPLAGAIEHAGWSELIYKFSINLAAMFGIAVLSTYLTEKLRTTGDELEESLRYRDHLEALNDNIVRSLSSGLITLDMKGRIMSFNEAAQGISGFREAEVLGKFAQEIFPSVEKFFARDPSLLDPRTNRHEITWRAPGGETRNLEFRLTPLRGVSEELLGTLVIVNDVTEIREMERRLRKADRLAAVGQLAAGIAHEIRNPLASISGSIQVLEHDLDLDATSKRLMQIVLRETSRLNTLITDFLLYARPTPRSIQDVMIASLIPDLVEMYQHRGDIHADIKWELDITRFLSIETDPKLIEQILWNLINNAVQAMPEGGVLGIRGYESNRGPAPPDETDASPPAGGRRTDYPAVIIEIEDTGPGIPAELRERIFDPFFTTRDGGTGLGLSTVYRIVESMEGTVLVEDGKTGGTVFVVIIPVHLKKEAEADKDGSAPAEEIEGKSGRNAGG